MLSEGDLAPAYRLYERYHQRAEQRFEWLLAALDEGLNFTYDSEMRLELDRQDTDRPTTEVELDELWYKRLKNAALTLDISGQDAEQIENNLRQRYEGQLTRLRQTNDEDAFGLFMAAVTGSVDPHTEYLSPRQGESFDIQMSLSLEGIGAMLQYDGEYVKVTSLVPGAPADRAGVLQPADRIVGAAQEGGESAVNVVAVRLDGVGDLIRRPKRTVGRLEVGPAEVVHMTRTHTVQITRDTGDLEDQAAQGEIIEVERDGDNQRIGVITIP